MEKGKTKKIRIHNTITKSYYYIRQKSSNAGRKGSVVEEWSKKHLRQKNS